MKTERRQTDERDYESKAIDAREMISVPTPGQFDISSLLEGYRGELHLHCYRLLGSLHDAEDLVQETMLRAWRHFDTFKGSSSLRTWLYTIATNACLDALKKRVPRTLPPLAYPQANPLSPTAPGIAEATWLEPYPDTWLAEATENPEARYSRHESISLAFLTALQLLPPRQRAILILADVLDWRASEIAHLLEISVPAVNSALHRARVTLAQNYHTHEQESPQRERADAATNTLLSRYLRAWEMDDVAGLVALLKEDAILSMPPIPSWYQGREAIRAFFLPRFSVLKRWRLCPTRANGQPAFVIYRFDEANNTYQAWGVQVLTLDSEQGQITEITSFHTSSFVASFGYPLQLS